MGSKWRAVLVVGVLLVGVGVLAPPSEARSPATPAPAPGAAARPSPEVAMGGLQRVVAGFGHSCAVATNGTLWCWGRNDFGQLGIGGTGDPVTRAVRVQNATGTGPLRDVVQVAPGDDHTCALLANGQVRCFGRNDAGQLGDGTFDPSPVPVAVRNPTDTANLGNVRSITGNSGGGCALLTNGQVRCWGDDDEGELGDGAGFADSGLPVAVANPSGTGVLTQVTAIDAGYDNMCARLANGQARCWGYGQYGGLGNLASANQPQPSVWKDGQGDPQRNIAQVAVGGYHACILLTNGTVRCAGYGGYGALGNGGFAHSFLSVLVRHANNAPLGDVRSIGIGVTHTCARLANSQVRCWGDDNEGHLGDGTIADPPRRPRPHPVRNAAGTANLTGVSQLSVGTWHTCVRVPNGLARCWGDGASGALGDGGTDDEPRPRLVQILS